MGALDLAREREGFRLVLATGVSSSSDCAVIWDLATDFDLDLAFLFFTVGGASTGCSSSSSSATSLTPCNPDRLARLVLLDLLLGVFADDFCEVDLERDLAGVFVVEA